MEHAMNKMARPIGTATYQDILDAPENMVAEIIYGALHTHPRPAMPHARAGSSLGYELTGPFDRGKGGPGGWWIIDEPEVHLGTDVLVPDLAGWRHETMPVYPRDAFTTVVPDWVCEIHSPSTRKIDQIDKSEIYASHGVKHMWFVDPDDRTLIAYENHDASWITIATLRDNDPVCVAPFDAVTFKLNELWS